jgi:hypothetical protein
MPNLVRISGLKCVLYLFVVYCFENFLFVAFILKIMFSNFVQ